MTVLIPLPSSPGDINLAPKNIDKNVRSDYLNAVTMVIIHDVLYDIYLHQTDWAAVVSWIYQPWRTCHLHGKRKGMGITLFSLHILEVYMDNII